MSDEKKQAAQVDVEALRTICADRQARNTAVMDSLVEQAAAEIEALREQVRALGSPFCEDSGEPALGLGCPMHGGDACLVMPAGAAKVIGRLRKDRASLAAEVEAFRCHDHATWKASCIGCAEEQGEGLSDDCRRIADALALVREKLVQGLRVYDWGCVKSAVEEIDAALAAAAEQGA